MKILKKIEQLPDQERRELFQKLSELTTFARIVAPKPAEAARGEFIPSMTRCRNSIAREISFCGDSFVQESARKVDLVSRKLLRRRHSRSLKTTRSIASADAQDPWTIRHGRANDLFGLDRKDLRSVVLSRQGCGGKYRNIGQHRIYRE